MNVALLDLQYELTGVDIKSSIGPSQTERKSVLTYLSSEVDKCMLYDNISLMEQSKNIVECSNKNVNSCSNAIEPKQYPKHTKRTCSYDMNYNGEQLAIKKVKLEVHKLSISSEAKMYNHPGEIPSKTPKSIKVEYTNKCINKGVNWDQKEKPKFQDNHTSYVQVHDNDADVIVLDTFENSLYFEPVLTADKVDICLKNNITCNPLFSSDELRNEKQSLKSPCYLKEISRDGNCFYRSISYALTECEDNHIDVRIAVANFLASNADTFVGFLRRNFTCVTQYLKCQKIMENGVWATEVEILVAAKMLGVDIYVYDEELKRWHIYGGQITRMGVVTTNKGIYLNHTDGNHYDVVLSVSNVKDTFCRETNKNSASSKEVFKCFDEFKNTENSDEPVKKKRKMKKESDSFVKENVSPCKSETIESIKVPKRKICRKKINNRKKCKEAKEKMRLKRSKDIVSSTIYNTNETYREKKKASQKRRYHSDELHQTQKKNSVKYKYKSDEMHRSRKKNNERKKYRSDEEHRFQKKNSERNKYRTDDEHRFQKKNSEKTKYRTDEEHRFHKKNSERNKYRTDEEHCFRKKNSERNKYRADEEHRFQKKNSERNKYKSDEMHCFRKKTANNNKYKINESYRLRKNTFERMKYRKDHAFRTRKKRYLAKKYKNDAYFRCFHNMYYRLRYKFNHSYNKAKKHNSHLQYCRNKNLKMSRQCKDKYRRNLFFRAKKISSLRFKYKMDAVHRSSIRTKWKRHFDQKKKIFDVINKFKNSFCSGPDYVCSVCLKLLFRTQVIQCHESKYKLTGCISHKYLHICSVSCSKNCVLTASRSNLWICYTCHRKLKENIVPAECWTNNLQLNDVPDVLSKLNSLERHLIAKTIPFMKIITLPKGGQFAVKGPVVSVPSDMSKGVSVLPRQPCDDQFVRVKLKRKLSYKGYYEYRNVNTKNVLDALEYLKENNKWYSDIDIDTMWSIKEDDNMEISEDVCSIENDNASTEAEHINGEHGKNEIGINDGNTENGSNEEDVDDEDESHGNALDSCLQPVNIGQRLLDEQFGDIMCIAPCEGSTPLRILFNLWTEAQTFPTLFPQGLHTYHEKRNARLVV
nr:uncharacterized protein LOC129284114 [Lytechinus pictus]XP_054775561.1 uncharacterized protein LOC129284114 [Lytechinus pictus]XP_054775563.1 uncharacterized protein LOC129284114 [Lytechinus pictus]